MTRELIDYLLTEGRAKILEKFQPTSCIASTRIGLEVLRSRGIECYPQACRVEALNPRAVEATKQGQGHALGTFSLGVEGTGAYDLADGSWDGHLVIVFRDAKGEVLLDLSADQMDRPQHGLRVKPEAVRITEGWPVGIMLPGGGAIAWERIRSRGYRQARDWSHRDRWEDVVAKIQAEAP